MLKRDYVDEIARILGQGPFHMSTGSTEPGALFSAVNEVFGLGIPPSSTKPETARGIVEAAGNAWLPNYESAGGTVTKSGLIAVLDAVRFFAGEH